MFEKAVRQKLRFNYKGICSVEDLWDLTVEELDSIYKNLRKQIKSLEGESLLNKKTKEDTTINLQIEIVEYIVKTKLQEAEARETAREKRAKKQKLLEVLASKEESELHGKSVEELKKEIEELD
jgi:hypothetical protein